MMPLLFAAMLALTPHVGVGADALPHKLHVSYAIAAVEGDVLAIRIRFFRDDLQGALAGHSGRNSYTLSVSPQSDALFMDYFRAHFSLEVAGKQVAGRIIGSGEDSLDREPVWWYAVQFDLPDGADVLHVTNTLLHEMFADQRNIVKFVHFPEKTQKTYSFGRGEETFDVSF